MVNKLVVDNQNIEINESTQIPFSYTFSTSGVHSVRIGLDNTEEICAYAFKDCKELSKVKFPSKITMIKRNAFENCISLKSIDIPKTIQYVGPGVFDGCDNLTEINFEDTIPPAVFYDELESNTNCYIPDGSKFIKVDYEDTIKDGSVQYYEKNDLGAYIEVDFESLEEGKEYYYDNWLTVHDHLHVIENRFKVKPERIAFVDGGVEVKNFGTIEQGTSAKLFNYVIEPENITNDKVYYYSNNPNLVSVSQNGIITAKPVSQGRATIYVCTEPDYENSYAFAFISVRVEDHSGIVKEDPELLFSSITATANTEGEFDGAPELINTNNVQLIWTSSKPSVATVDNNGVVTIIGNGTTRIKAKFEGNETYNDKEIYYDLTVNIPEEEPVKVDPILSFSVNNVEVDTAGELENAPILTNTNNVPLTWISSKPSVATVNNNGVVTVITNGTTIIRAIFIGNDTYNAKEVSYTLTVAITPEELGITEGFAISLVKPTASNMNTLVNPNAEKPTESITIDMTEELSTSTIVSLIYPITWETKPNTVILKPVIKDPNGYEIGFDINTETPFINYNGINYRICDIELGKMIYTIEF